MFRTIYLDFGNVIGFFDHGRAVARLAKHTPLPPAELTLALYGSPLEEEYELGHLSTEEYIRLARQHTGLTCSDEEFLEAFVDIFWRNDEVCGLIPRLARRQRLVLASNTNAAHYAKYSRQFADVLAYFSGLCPSHVMRARKPHKDYFERCQAEAHAAPAECLFLDDLTVNIEAAASHGWYGLEYHPGNNLEQQLVQLNVALD